MISNNNCVDLIDVQEASIFLNMKKSRLRNLVFQKQIPFLKIGASVRFDKGELLRWLASKKQGGF
jgi:excisionase family DNA binding protein